jgi:hypothetical protein
MQSTSTFITKRIPYFNYSNPVKHFYDQATQIVVTLLLEYVNTVREIMQSKKLMVLLALSTRKI